jgi:3-hydroxyisobutyrate dehydrogenase-like beta-hydroxyacid dehydrogenase
MRVGFCGLGIMGGPMASHLAKAGHELTVWTHTEGKAERFATEHEGVRAVDSPREAAAGVEVLITMLVDADQVRWALDGVTEPICLDMSTIGAPAVRELAESRRFVDAPVSGSLPGAESATLTIMVGGADADVQAVWPLLEVMGEKIVHVGPASAGQTVKVITNAVGAANCVTLAQALVVGSAAGVDMPKLVDVMGATAGGSAMVRLKGQPMLEHDWTPWFRLAHMLKDVNLSLLEAHEAGVPFPAAAEAAEMLNGGVGRGLGDLDFAAVLEVVEGMADHRL